MVTLKRVHKIWFNTFLKADEMFRLTTEINALCFHETDHKGKASPSDTK